jgi:hypothetical protein
MFNRCCLLLVAVGYLLGLEANVFRLLPRVDKPDNSLEQQGKDIPLERQWMSTRSSYFTSARPLNYLIHQAPAPIVDIEEGNYFEGDIILRPEQQLNSVSSFLNTYTKLWSLYLSRREFRRPGRRWGIA